MSFFGSIGHAISTGLADVGNFLSGDDEDQKKKQQQQQAQKAPNFNPNAGQNNNQPDQPQTPLLNLAPKKATGVFGQPVVSASTLAKAKQLQQDNQPSPATSTPTVPTPSFAPSDNNDPIGRFASGLVKAPLQLGDAIIHTPVAIAREIQNKPINDIQQQVFGTTDSGQIAQKILGDTVQTGLAVAAPGVDDAAEQVGAKVLAGERPAIQTLLPKVISNSAVGAGFNAGNAASQGENAGQIIKAGETGAEIGGAGGALLGGVPLLRKASVGADEAAPAAAPVLPPGAPKAPEEAATGIKSVNPNEAADAVAQTGQPEPAVITSSPASGEQPAQAPAQTGQPQLAPAEARPGQTPAPGQPGQPAGLPQSPTGAAQPTAPLSSENSSSATSVPQNTPPVNPTTAPNAPNVRAALVKQLGDAGKAAGDSTTHDVLSNNELNDAANKVVQSTPDAELLTQYSGVPNLHSTEDLAHANASLPKFAELSKSADPAVAQAATNAIDNVMEGVEKGTSGSGRNLNYVQSMYDTLPKEAKVSLTIRTLDKAREAAELPKIADNLPLRAEVEGRLNTLLSAGEDLQGKIAATEGDIEKIRDAAGTGQLPENASGQLGDLGKQLSDLQLQAQVQNGETARYYDSLVPGKAGLQKAADFARTSMLTAPSGRINNVFNVGGNSLYEVARSIPQAVAGKVINTAKGAGTATDSSLARRSLFTGARQGLKKVVAEARGDITTRDLKTSLSPDKAGGTFGLARTADNRGFNKVANLTHALVKAPGNVIGGALKQAQLERLAQQEGEQLGHTGEDLKVYTQARSLVPDRQMEDKAQQLKEVVSHTNDNPFARWADRISGGQNKATGQTKGAISLVKNTFLPFPKYAATFAWNTLTDRNVLADTIRAADAVKKGDVDGLTRAISGAALDGTGMYVGYHLTKMGLITNHDAQGYNDAGAYLHIGNRYIPLGILGVGAESLLAGNAMNQAVGGKGNPAEIFAKTVGDTVVNTIKTAGAQSLVGADNQGLTAVQEALTSKDNVSAGDAAAQVGGQAVGQFIPGAASDLNAVLNQTKLNPTHEAANTKVEKGGLTPSGQPSTAKNIPASEVKSLENRVPFLSQTLPRKAGVAANDIIDRITRGDRATGAEKQAASSALAKANLSAYDKAKNIPDPHGVYAKGDSFSNAIEARIENGKYDQAIQGLNQKLSDQKKDANIPKTSNDKIETQIKQLTVAKNGNVDPGTIQAYKKTSLTEWRDMGDSNSSNYDPATYQKLYAYDAALAQAGVSANTTKGSEPKYSAKTSKSGSGGGKNAALNSIKSNTIGSTPNLKNIDFGSLAPEKAISVKIPTIQQVQPGELIKKRAISVSKA